VRFRNCAVRGNGRAQGPDTRTGEAVHVDPDQPDLLRRRVVLPDLPTTWDPTPSMPSRTQNNARADPENGPDQDPGM
jgi:hypothetical protein